MRTMADLWRWAMEPKVPVEQDERSRRCEVLDRAVKRSGRVVIGELECTLFPDGDRVLLALFVVDGVPDAADVPIPDGVLSWRDRPPLL